MKKTRVLLIKLKIFEGGCLQNATAKPRPQTSLSAIIDEHRKIPQENMAAPIDLTLAKKNLQDAIGEDMRMYENT